MKKLIDRARRIKTTVSEKLIVASVSTFVALPAVAQEGEGGGGVAAVSAVFTEVGTTAATIFAAAIALWATLRGFTAIFRLGNKYIGKAGG